MNILYVWSDQQEEFNCSWHRCINPALAMRRAGMAVELIHNNEWQGSSARAVELTEKADVVIFQRNCFGYALGAIVDWVGKGKRVIIDLDDGYHQMRTSTGSPTSKLWLSGEQEKDGKKYKFVPVPLEQLTTGVKVAGWVSSPSQLILDDWAGMAQTMFIPNLLDLRVYQVRKEYHHEPGKIYIGWAGSMGHMQIWKESGVIDALNRVLAERKNVMIVAAGEKFWGNLNVSAGRKVETTWLPYALYPSFVANFDIGIIPLAGDYDRRRSCLKSLEYTAMKVPWVGSNLEPNRFLKTGRLVKNTAEAWYEALIEYIDHLQDYKARAVENYAVAQEWSIDENIQCIVDKYREVL